MELEVLPTEMVVATDNNNSNQNNKNGRRLYG